jgi:putative flippase GtrA
MRPAYGLSSSPNSPASAEPDDQVNLPQLVLSSLTVHPGRFLAKLGRYLAVSLIGTATTLILLGVLVGEFNVSPGWANLGAAGFSTALSFELDRRWVWRRQGRPSLVGQLLPFWGWSLAELALATFAVSWVGQRAVAGGWDHGGVTTLVELTSISISLLTWLVQYFVFDRVVFKDRRVHVGSPHPRPVAPCLPADTRTRVVVAAADSGQPPGGVARRRLGPMVTASRRSRPDRADRWGT